jgi:predicted PurR-regulated permease PerM
MPSVDARGAALIILAVLAVLFSLEMAAKFVIPLVVSVLLAYALNPLVYALERRYVPRVVGAFLVLTILVSGCIWGIYSLRGQAQSILNETPQVVKRMSAAADRLATGSDSSFDSVRRAAEALQRATAHTELAGAAGTQVVVAAPTMSVKDWAVTYGLDLLAFMGQAVMVMLLTFFLLLAGDKFKRKVVKVAGRTLTEKKITVQMFDEINRTVQRYLVMLLVTNSMLGAATWLAFRIIGLENAGTWALGAAILHLVPYLGPLAIALATGIAAFTQFGTFSMALLVAGTSLVIAAFIGTVLTTWMTGRLARMNTVAVFLSLLLFGSIWGVWGALLSMPIAVIFKVIADHIEGFEAISEFLGD